MGRPKTHDAQVADALVDAAEALADSEGLGAISVRAVAERSGTTTRAVYSLFGSKAGLVAALGARMFELLGAGVAAVPTTDDPADDLVEAGIVFRQLSVERPALFQIGVQQTALDATVVREFIPSASDAFLILQARFERLRDAGRLPGRTVSSAAVQFHALCEGLAALELRGSLPAGHGETRWREALSTLLDGMSLQPRS